MSKISQSNPVVSNLTPQERCNTAMAELDEILIRYNVCILIDEEGDIYIVPEEEEVADLIIEPIPAVH